MADTLGVGFTGFFYLVSPVPNDDAGGAREPRLGVGGRRQPDETTNEPSRAEETRPNNNNNNNDDDEKKTTASRQMEMEKETSKNTIAPPR